MAHNIANKNGKDAFFGVREKAWHGLGQIVQDVPNSEEAIKLAGLDYEVGLAPLYAGVKEIDKQRATNLKTVLCNKPEDESYYYDTRIVSNNFATFRKDTNDIFGVVGSRYTIVQNRDAFKFFDNIVGEGEAIYETAGALGNGEVIFITAKLPGYISVQNKDDIEKYLLLTSSHDGSGAIQAMFTPIRVVCNNTLQAALKGSKHKISIRHTKSVHEQLEVAHKLLGITNKLTTELGLVYDKMSKTLMTDEDLPIFIEKSLSLKRDGEGKLSTRSENVVGKILDYHTIGIGQDTPLTRNTVWGAYNAVTGYFNNVKGYDNANDKMKSNLLGGNALVMEKSLSLSESLIYGKSIADLN